MRNVGNSRAFRWHSLGKSTEIYNWGVRLFVRIMMDSSQAIRIRMNFSDSLYNAPGKQEVSKLHAKSHLCYSELVCRTYFLVLGNKT